jgi:hypothetical protein
VVVANARLSILAGKALTAITCSGLYEDNSKAARKFADRILVMGKDDLNKNRIADELDESSEDKADDEVLRN